MGEPYTTPLGSSLERTQDRDNPIAAETGKFWRCQEQRQEASRAGDRNTDHDGYRTSSTAESAGYVRVWDVFTTAYFSRDTRWLHADLNVGVNAWRIDSSALYQPLGALALSTELPHHLMPMVEVHGSATPHQSLRSTRVCSSRGASRHGRGWCSTRASMSGLFPRIER
jgi:hypothetical protein